MKILVAGDFCPGDRVATLLNRGDYAYVLGDVKDIITQADYSIVNFECPVTKGNEKPITKVGPNLHCSENGLEAAKWAGFNCVSLANNHILDFGDDGVQNTMNTCAKYKIDSVGGGMNLAEAAKTLYKTIDGQVLAIINCCEHEFSIATDKTGGANPLNPVQQYYAIKEARSKAEYIIVIVHGGHEYWQLPSPRMVETYRFFIDAGADAVVNHHQHCYSGYEIYNGKPILYGLGNFCFDDLQNKNTTWKEGYMVLLETEKPFAFSIYPYLQCDAQPKVQFLPKNAFNATIEKLNDIINDRAQLLAATQEYYSVCSHNYSKIFEPLNNRYYIGAKRRGWVPSLISKKRRLMAANFVLCEAHRDKLIWWLCNSL